MTAFAAVFLGMAAIIADSVPEWVLRSARAVMVVAALGVLLALTAMVAASIEAFRETPLARRIGWGSTRKAKAADSILAGLGSDLDALCREAKTTDALVQADLSEGQYKRLNRAIDKWQRRSETIEDAEQEARVEDALERVRGKLTSNAKNRFAALAEARKHLTD